MSEPVRMPVVFVGHGNPMNAIEDTPFRRRWAELGRQLPRPRAVLCVSAHWETRGIYVTASSAPVTIHDFLGFPQALFDVQYPAPGDPGLAQRTVELLAGYDARLDANRGLDHGVWSVLKAVYPAADIPVVQLSMDTGQPGAFHYEVAKSLAPLRSEAVLIVCSGNIVHNLRLLDFRASDAAGWAAEFDLEVRNRILSADHEALISWPGLSTNANLAVPTAEHYLPLLYALALRTEADEVTFFNSKVISSISMTSLVIGN
jgi:4,5-DOPA dioxygenase extradiol